jgi:HD domain
MPPGSHRTDRLFGRHEAFTPCLGGRAPPPSTIRVTEGSGVRLADLLVALSLATDLGFGQPAEHMLRSARISMRLGDRLALSAEDLGVLYDVSLLTYVACPVYGDVGAAMFGDDIAFRAGAVEVDLAGFPAMVFMMRRAGYGTSTPNRMRQRAKIMATRGRGMLELMAAHCGAAGELADRMGLGSAVRDGIQQSYARWDGQGVPLELSGQAISLAARISHVAEACEVIQRNYGTERAVEMVRARRGTHFDPEIAAAVELDPQALFEGSTTIRSGPFEKPNPSPDRRSATRNWIRPLRRSAISAI